VDKVFHFCGAAENKHSFFRPITLDFFANDLTIALGIVPQLLEKVKKTFVENIGLTSGG
jgi:hypothetical protein